MKKKAGDKKIRYINGYNRQRYRRVTMLVPLDEEEVLDKLDSVPSKSDYLLSLVKKDLG